MSPQPSQRLSGLLLDSPPNSPRVKAVVEKTNSVSFILDLTDPPPLPSPSPSRNKRHLTPSIGGKFKKYCSGESPAKRGVVTCKSAGNLANVEDSGNSNFRDSPCVTRKIVTSSPNVTKKSDELMKTSFQQQGSNSEDLKNSSFPIHVTSVESLSTSTKSESESSNASSKESSSPEVGKKHRGRSYSGDASGRDSLDSGLWTERISPCSISWTTASTGPLLQEDEYDSSDSSESIDSNIAPLMKLLDESSSASDSDLSRCGSDLKNAEYESLTGYEEPKHADYETLTGYEEPIEYENLTGSDGEEPNKVSGIEAAQLQKYKHADSSTDTESP